VFTPDSKSLSTAESEIFNTVKYTEYSNTDYAKEVLKCSEVLEKKKNELTCTFCFSLPTTTTSSF
jgi:hypothetical protein